MTAIELDGVTKRFGDVTAVDDVDLSIEVEEIFGFLGPNGAGKSTTINMLLDLVRPTGGSVSVLGLDARSGSVTVRERTGVLPERFDVWERLTGRQHVQFAIDSKRSNRDDDADVILNRVGLSDAADRMAGGYSKGMKQRLALGMALVGDPDLLILDEPTTGLDPTGARDLREIVREENERGATVFFSSHILGQVEAVCDRVGIMLDGEMVAADTVRGLRDAVGGGATLSVSVDTVTDGLTDAVQDCAGVTAVETTDTRLRVTMADGDKTAVLDAVEGAGAAIEDFGTEEPSLEDLFLAYAEEGAAA
jgi:ABC-2 type transport system ATP-binding protein